MRKILLAVLMAVAAHCTAQDVNKDVAVVNPACTSLIHLLNLFTIHGAPQNQNDDDELSILINHGYCLGYSKKYNQPRWAAYQVSKAKETVDYERFPFFVDDLRLPEVNRIGSETFGNHYDRGHLAPNAAINKQYGKIAQMESFLMSNISPQRDVLNQGVWQKLEAAIREKYCNAESAKKHVWVIVGPIFPANPAYITRPNGVKVAIPKEFFCILSRTKRYPEDSPSSSEYLAFIFPQELPKNQELDASFLVSIDEVERRTCLNFFPEFTTAQQSKLEKEAAAELWATE